MAKSKKTRISIVAENEEDMAALDPCAETLKRIGLKFERRFLSAILAPDHFREFSQNAYDEGKRVIIAGVNHGMLSGMMQAFNHRLLTICVPVGCTYFELMTALLSSFGMPKGEPVAVSNGAMNAAIFTGNMFAEKYPSLWGPLDQIHEEIRQSALEANERLHKLS